MVQHALQLYPHFFYERSANRAAKPIGLPLDPKSLHNEHKQLEEGCAKLELSP